MIERIDTSAGGLLLPPNHQSGESNLSTSVDWTYLPPAVTGYRLKQSRDLVGESQLRGSITGVEITFDARFPEELFARAVGVLGLAWTHHELTVSAGRPSNVPVGFTPPECFPHGYEFIDTVTRIRDRATYLIRCTGKPRDGGDKPLAEEISRRIGQRLAEITSRVAASFDEDHSRIHVGIDDQTFHEPFKPTMKSTPAGTLNIEAETDDGESSNHTGRLIEVDEPSLWSDRIVH